MWGRSLVQQQTLLTYRGRVTGEVEGPLTERQLEILAFVRSGLNDKEIAERAGISIRMVRKHLQAICAKLRCNTRAHAVAIALRRGLIAPLEM